MDRLCGSKLGKITKLSLVYKVGVSDSAFRRRSKVPMVFGLNPGELTVILMGISFGIASAICIYKTGGFG